MNKKEQRKTKDKQIVITYSRGTERKQYPDGTQTEKFQVGDG